MAVRKIVQLGDEHLKRKSESVKEINEEVKLIIKDLKDTLATVEGIGLAAPQIAVNKKIIYINFGDGKNEYVLINPKILGVSKETYKDYEGCLSYVMHEGLVERPKAVKIQALNENGEMMVYEAQDLLARCFFHEIDHLDGIMYVDRAIEMYELVDEN
ncbi:peptide deformylase [Clostridium tarantellae]|uniref:Peptide deformylase n=1 Tax=Clostridium tarantellae TaxID=39493 RepID=A0A6I1MPE6_9CLOT|nr:peptide deformylase [Clostridium tarantellae]MPQ44944.1 peptide deformylase [Clostridium tarantellae]